MSIEVTQVGSGAKGAFEAFEGETKAGEMTYTWAGEDKIIIDHTDVDPDFGGKGVGKTMVLAAVEFAREKGIRIMPLCPFAKSVFDKNEDLKDVLF